MQKPSFAFIGTLLIPLFILGYYPIVALWIHRIETHATADQRQNPAYINGYYAFGPMIDTAGIFAGVLAALSITSLLRREPGAPGSLIYGVPALLVSIVVAVLHS